MGVGTRMVHPDMSEVLGARDAEGAQVVYGRCPGVVVVGAVAWAGAGRGGGGVGGLGCEDGEGLGRGGWGVRTF